MPDGVSSRFLGCNRLRHVTVALNPFAICFHLFLQKTPRFFDDFWRWRLTTLFHFAKTTRLTMHKLCGFWVQFRPKPATVSLIPF